MESISLRLRFYSFKPTTNTPHRFVFVTMERTIADIEAGFNLIGERQTCLLQLIIGLFVRQDGKINKPLQG